MLVWRRHARILFAGLALITLLHVVSFLAFVRDPQPFYYRSWEWFEDFPYHSNDVGTVWEGREEGDLSTKNFFLYKYSRQLRVSSDEYGFRTIPLHADQYGMAVAGDSFIWGCGLSDDETLPALLARRLDTPVYNGSRANLSNVLRHPQLAHVKTIIDGRAERKIRGYVFQRYGPFTEQFTPLAQNDMPAYETYLQVNPKRYSPIARIPIYVEQLSGDLLAWFDGRAEDYYIIWPHKSTPRDLKNAVWHIHRRQRILRQRGIRYIFLPIPAKQTLHDPDIDDYTRQYLHRLVAALRARGVEVIDLLSAYEAHAKEGLFQRYDSHWDPRGVELAAETILEYLRTHPAPKAQK